MTAPIMQLTTAGRAAMVNVENTGTAAIRIAQIGVTAQAFVPAAGQTTLPGEIKRLPTYAGDAVAADMIHVTLRDDSTDQYTLRGFGFYAEDGTLVGTYGQADPIMEKSANAMLLLGIDGRLADLDATSLTFGDTDWMNPPATTTVQGVVELADNSEAIAGTDATRAMTPAAHKAAIDDRLGAGAPHPFVKGLLTLATAALMRAAIGLGNVAVRNEGAGNGLDSDLLDGKHGAWYLDWANLTNVPQTFSPIAHRHAWGDLDNVPTTATRWPSFGEVTGKPVTYPPSAHTHAAADVTSGVFDVLRIPDVPIGKVTNLQSALDAKAPLNNPQFTGTGIKVGANNGGESNIAFGADDWYIYTNTATFGLYSGSKGAGWSFSKADKVFSVNGQAVWHAGNFNPANKSDTNHSHGAAYVINDSNGANVVALGWIGGQIRARVDGSTWNMWHTGNFDPNSKATNGANVYFADITASRGNGTGVIFLGGGNRYLFFNGGSYEMPGAQLVVEGGFQKGSSRELKIIDGPLPYGLDELMRIETAIGRYKPEFIDEGERRRLFVIAEQLAEVVPEPVFAEAIDWEDRRVAAVDDGQLVPLLIKSMQQLAERVFALEGNA